MRQLLKDLMLVVFFILTFAALPFALSPDNPLHQPPRPPVTPVVDVNANAPWGTISLVMLGTLILFTLVVMAWYSNMSTQPVDQVEDQQHG